MKKLILLIFVLFLYAFVGGCDTSNKVAESELSKTRIAQIDELEKEIEELDRKISLNIRTKQSDIASYNEPFNPARDRGLEGPPDSSYQDSEISRLSSKREILVKKVMVLYEIEQKYQSRK